MWLLGDIMPDMTEVVVIVFWLISGEPAFDYYPRPKCELLKLMTEQFGGVEMQLEDGSILQANRIECRAITKMPTADVPTQ